MIRTLTIEQEGMRLDACLSAMLDNMSRNYIRRMFDEGRITIQGKPVKPSLKTKIGTAVSVDVPDPVSSHTVPEAIPLNIAYEDEWLMVVNKPQGMVVHPAPGHHEGTLVNALLFYCGDNLSSLNGVLRPGIVHRIDKDTSGLLLVVKNNEVHADIAARIRRHEVTRKYLAMVYGTVSQSNGTVDAPIGRDPRNRKRMAVVRDGKPAITHFTVLDRYASATWIECRLETGRTHQIRVHMAAVGHPVVGDPLYAQGKDPYGQSGQALHAAELEFVHPVTGETVRVHADLPEHLRTLREQMR